MGALPASLSPTASFAQSGSPEVHDFYEAGVKHFKDGEYPEALDAFVKADELSSRMSPRPPHAYRVICNIGRTHVRLGRSVEAVAALQRCCEDAMVKGKTTMPEAELHQIESIIADQMGRIAEVAVRVSRDGALISVDGTSRGTSPLQQPIRVDAGKHTMTITLAGYEPFNGLFAVLVGERRTEPVELRPVPPVKIVLGRLSIQCPIPAMGVSIDDQAVGETPFAAALPIPIGRHEVSFKRAGYLGNRESVTVGADAALSVQCNPGIVPALAPTLAAWISVDASDATTTVLVDGAPPPRGGLVPPGLHHIEVSRPAYLTWAHDVTLSVGQRETLHPQLALAPERLSPEERVARTHFRWAGVAGGLGGVSAVVGAIAGAVVLGRKGLIDRECADILKCSLAGKAAWEDIQAPGVVSTAGFSLAGAALVVTVVLLITAPTTKGRRSGSRVLSSTMLPVSGGATLPLEWSF